MSGWMELTAADGFRFPVYRAQPSAQVKGAVVVLQEIFGVNAHIRSVTDGFAKQGYLALAPATFHRIQAGVELAYTQEDVASGVALKMAVESLPAPGVLQDIQATVDEAQRSSGGKVGVVGYCWGGLMSWRAACALSNLSSAVTYYGGGMTLEAEIARRPRVPVLAHFARQDQSIPLAGVDLFRQAHPEVALHLYDASHGFNCDHRAAHDAPAATLALERTLAFFAKTLHA